MTKQNILILPNLHIPNNSINTGGMEISADELANSIHLSNLETQRYKIVLGSHPESNHSNYSSDILYTKRKFDFTTDFEKQKDINDILLYDLINRALDKYGDIPLIVDQTSSLVPIILSKIKGVKCIKTIRINSNYYDFDSECMPDCIVYTTEFSKSLKYFDCKSLVIHDYFSTSCFENKELKKHNKAISVGRVHPGKGHENALRISRQMNLPLIIVGPIIDFDYAKYLERNGAVLYGGLPRIELLKLIKESLYLIWTPNEYEPGGRVVIESLKLGTHVIAHKIGIASDIIELNRIPAINAMDSIYIIDSIPNEFIVSFKNYGTRYLELINDIISS